MLCSSDFALSKYHCFPDAVFLFSYRVSFTNHIYIKYNQCVSDHDLSKALVYSKFEMIF